MKKIFWASIFVLAVLAGSITWFKSDWIVDPPILKDTTVQCVGNPDGKCEFNPVGALDKEAPAVVESTPIPQQSNNFKGK